MAVLTLPSTDALSVRAKALVFKDPKSVALLHHIERIARSEATVLVHGETGTGKEIAARHVHALSPRAEGPFVAVNCGALADALVESELFGHERGAFTGASQARAGWFETAHGGSLFLDEIGDLSFGAQVKLLRVLQEGEVVRLGSRRPLRVDVRVIAATNVELEAAVAAGRFRRDLYYRLKVASLELPPLRERIEDIGPLAEHFIDQHTRSLDTGPIILADEAIDALLGHDWPGNIRELENVIHHALLVCHDQRITLPDLRLTGGPSRGEPVPRQENTPLLERALLELFEENVPDLYLHLEERIMRAAYRFCDTNQLQTARLLGISRNVVRARLIQFGELSGSVRPPPQTPAMPKSAVSSLEPSRAPEQRRIPRPRAAPSVLRVGYQQFGRLPLLKASLALERALEPAGLRVEWHEYLGGTQLIEAFEPAQLSLGVVGDGPAVLALAARVPIVYLAAEALAPEGEAIVVPFGSEARSVSDLRGGTIMVNRGANAHHLLLRALEEAELDDRDVRIEYLPPDRALAAFRKADVAAWAIWDPFLGAAQRNGGARTLRDGRGLSEHAAYYIGSRTVALEHPEVIPTFLRTLNAIAPSVHEPLRTGTDRCGAVPMDAGHITRLQAVADAFLRHAVTDRPVTVSTACWVP